MLPLDQTIIHQDGSSAQPNPPVFLLAPHLFVAGDFKVTVLMEGIDSIGSFRLYAHPPVVYDQWRYESPSIEVEAATSTIVVRVWDGSSSRSIDMRTYPFVFKNSTEVFIEHIGNTFRISANKRVFGSIPDHSILENQEVWFGASAGEGNGWVLAAGNAEPLEGGSVTVLPPPLFAVPHDEKSALRNLAQTTPHKLQIGAAVSFGALVTDEKYRDLAVGQFSMWTPENGMKPQFIHPGKDAYSFGEMDVLVRIALQNNIQVHGHALVYAKSNPSWITDTAKEEREQVMVDHIQNVAGHFKGKVVEWDVVNEPLSNKKVAYHDNRRGLDSTLWYEAMGEQYIDKAFFAAHEADPAAKLYINDYGLERDGERWDALVALVKRLKSRGVPIDGVGFEAHIYNDGDYIDEDQLEAHMKALAHLGLSARISEIDVTGDDASMQIQEYTTTLAVCLRAQNCTSYTTWGITDRYGSTTRSDRYPLVFGTSLLWDSALKEKPVVLSLRGAFLH